MYVEKILKLPALVRFEGITFEMTIFREGSFELRLCYKILVADKTSPYYADVKKDGCWQNPFDGNRNCDFLYLVENIGNDRELKEAVDEVYDFLKENNLF